MAFELETDLALEEESVEQEGAFSFGESEERGAERFVVVDAVECGVVVAEGVCDGPSVGDCCRVEGDCVVGVTGGGGLPDSEGSTPISCASSKVVGAHPKCWVREVCAR
ncbi:hypothetical protein [Rhodococcus erythropolis]